MKLLLIVPAYPYAGFPSSGIFNRRSALALDEVCEHVEVLSPRPYAPPTIGRLRRRWKSYSQIPPSQQEGRLVVHRPAYLQIPGAASPLWAERAAYLSSRGLAVARHKSVRFDAILSFDLRGAAPLAWRLARRLRLPAAGWATGGDIRVERGSATARAVTRSLRNLDLVFYQSEELRGIAAGYLGGDSDVSPRRHVVLSRGISEPPARDWEESRARTRARLGLADDETAVLSIGRICEGKGIYDLLTVASRVSGHAVRLRFVLVGASPGFDESEHVAKAIRADPNLSSRVQLLPACSPEDVWEYLAAADIFAFASHAEGMPNSPLEAMAMERPVVAFAIPPILELDANAGVIALCRPFDVEAFSESILRLAVGRDERHSRGREGRVLVHHRFLLRRNMALAVEKLEEMVVVARRNEAAIRSVAGARQAG